MKITHAIPAYAPAWQFGGPVLSVSRLCQGLASEGVNVRVLTTNAGLPDLPHDELGRPVMESGVEVIRYPVEKQTGAIRSSALEKELSLMLAGTDLLHLSAIWQPLGIAIQRAAHEVRIPVLHSTRGALGPYSLRRGWWKKLPYLLLFERPMLQKSAGIHVTSYQEADEMNWLQLRPTKHQLPNPLNLDQLGFDSTKRQRERQRLGIYDEMPLILVCGRQHHKKGIDMLPELLASQQHKPWRLLLVGSDSDGSGAKLLRDLEKRGLSKRIRVEPTMPAHNLKDVYNAADLLLLPSRHENFGNVVIEALACGCAVLISDRTGVAANLLADAPPDFGAVLPRREKYWIDWLGKWLNQPTRAGFASSKWAAENFGQQGIARQAINVYSRILHDSVSRAVLL